MDDTTRTANRLMLPAGALFLLLLIAVSFAPVLTGPAEFIGDDYYFVANNPRVTSHGFDSFRDIWAKPMQLEYFPVTITSYALEYRLWGNNVKAYRFTNLMLFWCIGLAGWSLAVRLASDRHDGDHGMVMQAAFVATAAMLLHPTNVESAACIANRKELLYVLFGLLTLRLYATPERTGRVTLCALACMAVAQLSKGSGVIVPLLLLVYELFHDRDQRPLTQRFRNIIPFAGVAAVIFVIQFLVAFRSGVVAREAMPTLAAHAGGVIRTFNFMIGKFIRPVNLSYDYDISRPSGFPPAGELILPVVAAGLLCLLFRKKNKNALMAALLVLVPLAPYLQIVPLAHNLKGQMVYYDHYLLFSAILCVIPITCFLAGASVKRRKALLAVPAVLAACWVVCDYQLSGHWQTRETLYKRIIAVSPSLPKAYLFLGRLYVEEGRYPEAIRVLKGIFGTKQWDPVFAEAYQALGDAYAFSGNYREAEKAYRAYLARKPDDLKSLQNLSTTLIQLGEHEAARRVISNLLAYYPTDRIGFNNLSVINGQQR